MVPAVPLVPDLNLWPPLIGALVAVVGVGVVAGVVDYLSEGRTRTRSTPEERGARRSSRLERKAA